MRVTPSDTHTYKNFKRTKGHIYGGWFYYTRKTKFISWRVITLECERYVTSLDCMRHESLN